jgi:outer membrane protein assembly factor BamB
MATRQLDTPASRKPLRLWPGVAAAALLLLVRLGLPIVWPEGSIYAILGALVAAVVILGWWLFFSRAPWSERLGAVVLMIVALAATSLLVHVSIRNGMMGMMLGVYGIPLLCVALVAGAVAGGSRPAGLRRASMVAAIVVACGLMVLVRTGGVTGDGDSDLHWRWTPTPEQRLLAQTRNLPAGGARIAPVEPVAAVATPAAPETAAAPVPAAMPERTPAPAAGDEPAAARAMPTATAPRASWPGFRGPARDGVIRNARIETDWARTPPVEVWRRPIGPGWSSFAVLGDLVYTQEQRGEDEVVSCYSLATGDPVWRHSDAARFWESNGGAGPRGTPTVDGGRVYTLGATGILNALDARSGAVVWSRNAATDTGKKIPDWGLASSPLVVNDLVIVAVAGQLIAYDVATGAQRWIGETGGGGYSSPHLARIGGVEQVLLLRGARTISVAPAAGTLLWEHTWLPAVSIIQPAVTADGSVLIGAGDGMGGLGIRRIAVARGPAGWRVDERWTSRGLKPYYNDFVVHEGHAYGFDGSILSSIDVADGARKWKGGRYGNGQLVLLPDQDLLLVLSEDGELALVSATPDKFTEVARFPALEGKTWNHPVLVGDLLLVRNGEEMAAFRLSSAGR